MQQQGILNEVWSAASDGVTEAVIAATQPEVLLVLLCGFALTHWFKAGLELFLHARGVCFFEDRSMQQRAWRFVVHTSAMVIYAASGLVWAYFEVVGYMAVPAIAILAPLLWRVIILLPIPLVRRVMTTAMDRKLLGY